jgi:UDP-N-acetylmuramoylalanine--D-glutamate ligase
MGLGLLGRGVGDAIFLAECGAKLTITDLKTKAQLKDSLAKLRKHKNIKYVLGKHRLEDFRNCDMVLKAAGVPLDSPYIREARKNNIPVEMSAALFARLSGIPMLGVTGTRGKSTVTHLVAHILEAAGRKIVLGGNVRGVSNLQLLKNIKGADMSVFELDSWQLQGFGDSKISPHVAVFTTFYQDHFIYYKKNIQKYFSDKVNIFKYQKSSDILISGKQPLQFIKKEFGKIKSKVIVAGDKLPKGWKINLPGSHNEYNATLAVEATRACHVSDAKIKSALSTFEPLSGRLQFLGEKRGIKVYNDNSSTTPEATIAALRALSDKKERKIVLIMGGDDKLLDMSKLLKEIPERCSKVVLFKEKGTDKIRDKVFTFTRKGVEVYEEEGLSNTVKRAFKIANKQETILFSPAFFSFGKYFKNEFDRGDQFVKIVNKIK